MSPPTTLGSVDRLEAPPSTPLDPALDNTNSASSSTSSAPRAEVEAKPLFAPFVRAAAGSHPALTRRLTKRKFRVAAVIPCYNRPADVEKLLGDLSRVDTRGIDLWVVIVDNASTIPMSAIPTPKGLVVEHHRLETNTGGAGGFNAGMARILAGDGLSGTKDAPDFVWLLDSDVRVSRRSLHELVRAMLSDEGLAAVGSALIDPITNVCYELGGRLNRTNGYFVPAARGDVDRRLLIPCKYLAACSALVRRESIEKTGLMPEIFIHGDDVEWFLRMGVETGKKLAAVPSSRAYHPLWSRKFQTWVRYYTTRNAYAPIDVLGFGPLTRSWRALVDVLRATAQAMMGMPELADLHLQGLADAAAGRTKGFGPRGGIGPIIAATKTRPIAELSAAVHAALAARGPGARLYFHPILVARAIDFKDLPEQLAILNVSTPPALLAYWKSRGLDTNRIGDTIRALWRWVMIATRGWKAEVAVVPTGWPTAWFRGRTLIQMTSDGFLVREIRRGKVFKDAARCLWVGSRLIAKVALRKRQFNDLPPAPARKAAEVVAELKPSA
jgi:GT2 family glycosyltransferase